MYNKGKRIGLIVFGSFLLIYKDMFVPFLFFIIPLSANPWGILLLIVSTFSILLGIFGFKEKSKSDDNTEN